MRRANAELAIAFKGTLGAGSRAVNHQVPKECDCFDLTTALRVRVCQKPSSARARAC